ncbi:MAG TPA: GDSL-type esterase/lipase family protein [Flavisolibacter sp.]|nr:GDSL-type esterase/lipase family protein [Flavisolibacter sp.]
MKRFVSLLAAAFLFQFLQAQTADSSFHNYWYDSRLQYFKQLPAKKSPVVFWGDSITEWADWNELTGLGNVLNRGIAGDISFGLLHRLGEVVRHKPKKVFILIGTNDLSKGIPVPAIVRTYTKVLHQLQADLPSAKLYVQSVFPINDSLINRQYYKGTNAEILQLNAALKRMAAENKVAYVNVNQAMLDEKKQLRSAFTYDGLHLSGKGYLQWVAYLKKQKLL